MLYAHSMMKYMVLSLVETFLGPSPSANHFKFHKICQVNHQPLPTRSLGSESHNYITIDHCLIKKNQQSKGEVINYTPRKINKENENDGLEDFVLFMFPC